MALTVLDKFKPQNETLLPKIMEEKYIEWDGNAPIKSGGLKTINNISLEGSGNITISASTEHSHAISAITNLQTVLDGKSGTAHTHNSLGETPNNSIIINNGKVRIETEKPFTESIEFNNSKILTNADVDRFIYSYTDITEDYNITNWGRINGQKNVTNLSTTQTKEFYAGWSSLEVNEGYVCQSAIHLPAGKYAFHVDGFYRQGGDGRYSDVSQMYIRVGAGSDVFGIEYVKPLTYLRKNTYAGSIAEAEEDFRNGLYHTFIEFITDGVNDINIDIHCKFDTAQSWGIVSNPRLFKMTHIVNENEKFGGLINLKNTAELANSQSFLPSLLSTKDYLLTDGNGKYPSTDEFVTVTSTEQQQMVFRSPDEAIKIFINNFEAYYKYLNKWYSENIRDFLKPKEDKTFYVGSTVKLSRVKVDAVNFLSQYVDFDSINTVTSKLGSVVAAAAKLAIAGNGSMSDGEFIKWMIRNDKIFASIGDPNDGSETLQLTKNGQMEMYTTMVISPAESNRQVIFDEAVNAGNITHAGLYTNMTVGRPATAGEDGDTSYTLLCGNDAQTQMCVGNVTGKLWTRSNKGTWEEIAKKKDIGTQGVSSADVKNIGDKYYATTSHTHNNYSLTGHTHGISDVSGLQTALNGKSDTGHTHTNYSPTGHGHSNYALTSHTHAISSITNLQTTLNGKSDTGHTHTNYSPTGHTHNNYSTTGHTHTVSNIVDFPQVPVFRLDGNVLYITTP